MDIKEKVSIDINVPISLIDEALTNAHRHVKKFHIPKRKGGYRVICQPSAKLKTIQYWIINNICSRLPVDDAAYAYRDGVSILNNATYHASNKYFLKVDLKDFFPSISFNDFIKIVRIWHKSNPPIWELNRSTENVLKKSCFDDKGKLPIGYPSSPSISNSVMYSFDLAIKKEIENNKYGAMLYTRYADDLIFSTDKKGACHELLQKVRQIIRNTTHPSIRINDSKVSFSSATGGSALVTGLRVAYDGHVTLHKKQKDHVRLLLSLYKKGKLDKSEHSSLLGHIAYAKYIDPAFYSKLQQKFFREIDKIRKRV